jgi:hypothetical protein
MGGHLANCPMSCMYSVEHLSHAAIIRPMEEWVILPDFVWRGLSLNRLRRRWGFDGATSTHKRLAVRLVLR